MGRFKEFSRDKKPRNAKKQEPPAESASSPAAPPKKGKALEMTRSVCSPIPLDGEDTTTFEDTQMYFRQSTQRRPKTWNL